MYRPVTATLGLLTLFTAACARYEPDARLPDVRADVASRTGLGLPAELQASPTPFSGELSPDDAARMALQFNPNLHAALEDLNVATAREVQAGLLINPTLGGQILFEEDGVRPMLDFGLAFELGRLLTRGRRMRLTTAEREQVEAEVTEAIVQTMVEARAATISLWAAEQQLALQSEVVTVHEAAANAAQILSDAGNFTAGDLAMHRRALVQSRFALGQAQLARIDALEALSNVTGTIISADASAILEAMSTFTNEEAFIKTTLENSLTLKAERKRIEALGIQVGLANVSVWLDGLEAEAAFEREEDDTAAGFGATLSLPIFDGGRARTGAARAALEAAELRYRALAFAVANRARAILGMLEVAKTAANDLSPDLLVQTGNEFDFEQRQLNGMQIGPLGLLAAKAKQLENQIAAVEMQQLWALTSIQADALKSGVALHGLTDTEETER
ncbi:MAG: TolC family protein [Kordiimonadaceae bacterium]|nr:TolC family protein [Kordiimonadaceae bacterium]MBO6569598.1 TolC family protein [Kordiimonadaceae bacterium]MBO6966133.1 TolC family protein [Kordiimonadaceae bacterium]